MVVRTSERLRLLTADYRYGLLYSGVSSLLLLIPATMYSSIFAFFFFFVSSCLHQGYLFVFVSYTSLLYFDQSHPFPVYADYTAEVTLETSTRDRI